MPKPMGWGPASLPGVHCANTNLNARAREFQAHAQSIGRMRGKFGAQAQDLRRMRGFKAHARKS